MEIRLDVLLDALEKTEERKFSLDEEIKKNYIYQKVFRVMAQGKEIRVKDLDFSRFTVDDIMQVSEYAEETVNACQQNLRVADHLISMPPISHAAPMFI